MLLHNTGIDSHASRECLMSLAGISTFGDYVCGRRVAVIVQDLLNNFE